MKICLSSTGENLKATVDQRFGRCQYFLIVDTQTMNVKTLSNQALLSSGGAGIQAAQIIAKEGVNAVITGNIGPNAFKILQAQNIEIYTQASGTIQEVIEQFKNGTLQQTKKATVQSHAGIGGKKQ